MAILYYFVNILLKLLTRMSTSLYRTVIRRLYFANFTQIIWRTNVMPCHLRNSKEPFVFPNVFPPFACIIMGYFPYNFVPKG